MSLERAKKRLFVSFSICLFARYMYLLGLLVAVGQISRKSFKSSELGEGSRQARSGQPVRSSSENNHTERWEAG